MTWTMVITVLLTNNPSDRGQEHRVPGWSTRELCEASATGLMTSHDDDAKYFGKVVIATCRPDAPRALTLPTPR